MKTNKMMATMNEIFDEEFYEEREAIRNEAQQVHEMVIQRLQRINRSADGLEKSARKENQKRNKKKE